MLIGGTYELRLFYRKQKWRVKLPNVHGVYQTLSINAAAHSTEEIRLSEVESQQGQEGCAILSAHSCSNKKSD